jgi:hypothetical protein
MALPVVLITAALAIDAAGRWLAHASGRIASNETLRGYVRAGVAVIFIASSAYASASVMPHYRLYTNALGGGQERAGSYFPHDEFYDASMSETARRISALARPGARVATEAPELFSHYAALAGRTDLVSISLSDRAALQNLTPGDIIVIARGRRYFSNDALITKLETTSRPEVSLSLGVVPSTRIYMLDEPELRAVAEATGRQ